MRSAGLEAALEAALRKDFDFAFDHKDARWGLWGVVRMTSFGQEMRWRFGWCRRETRVYMTELPVDSGWRIERRKTQSE